MNTGKTIAAALAAIVVLIVAQVLAQLAAMLLVLVHIPESVCNVIAGALYIALAFVLLRWFSKKLLRKKLDALGMPKFFINFKWLAVGLLLPLAVKAVYLLCFSGEYVRSQLDPERIALALSAGIAFTGFGAGFVEEMVFRGAIMHLLKEKWGVRAAVVLPSVLFGLVHIIGMDFSIMSSLLVVLAGTMVGIMFSMIALESGSVWNSGIVHALWNIVIFGGGLSIGQEPDQYAIMTYVLDSSSFALTGGEFGIESSAIALAGYLLVTLAAMGMLQKRSEHSVTNSASG